MSRRWPWRPLTALDMAWDGARVWLNRLTGLRGSVYLLAHADDPLTNEMLSQLDGEPPYMDGGYAEPGGQHLNRQRAEAFNRAMRNLGMIPEEGAE